MNDEENDPGTSVIRRLVGVYNANGTFTGELAYYLGARLGRAHCSLCDITHGRVRERSEWKQCVAALPVPFDSYHLNDQPTDVRAAAGGAAPIVVAETDRGLVVLLGEAELSACAGSVEALSSAIERAVTGSALRWPEARDGAA